MLKASDPEEKKKLLDKIAATVGINNAQEFFPKLFAAAKEAMPRAYASYSKFRVGCAVLTADGRIYSGCNVENASLPVGICAEVCAASKAVSEGATKFLAAAVYCEKSHSAWPCGRCRQFLSEFGGPELIVITERPDGSLETMTMEELLPRMFGPGDMSDLLNSP